VANADAGQLQGKKLVATADTSTAQFFEAVAPTSCARS
jgi:hypothetical protein